MAKVVFFVHDRPESVDTFEYYKQDVDALRALGHHVVICTRFVDVPRRFDAMFVWWWTHALAPVLLCRGLGRPCIITGTFNFRFPADFSGTDFFRRPGWQRLLIGRAAIHSSLNLFVSELELEGCSRHFSLENARYYPHCVQDDYLLGPAAARALKLMNISWSGKENLIRKGIPELLEAICILRSAGEPVELSLAGLEGDGAGWLRERIAQLGIGDAVHHLGRLSREEKIRLLRMHEVYVQPSHYEGFGLAILEAMGCGACAIVCDVGAVREVVGDAGAYVRPSAPQELAATISALLRDETARRRLQAAAGERARTLFTFEAKVRRLEGFLREVGIQSPAAPPT